MKKLFTFLTLALFAIMANAQTKLIDYPTTKDGITLVSVKSSGETTTDVDYGTVKVKNVDTDCIKFGKSIKMDDVEKYYAELSVEGGFKAGDVIAITGCFKNSDDTKSAAIDFWVEKENSVWNTENFLNTNDKTVEPVEQTFTLTADADKFYIGRSGNTATCVLALSITRTESTPEPAGPVTDVLTALGLGATEGVGTSYSNFTGKTFTSDAVYSANMSAGNVNAIQLRTTNNNSGIVTTTSGGKLKSVQLTWSTSAETGGATAAARAVEIFGSNTAYSAPSELYSDDTKGTSLGTLAIADATDGVSTLDISGSYEYFGLKSTNGALYLTQVEVTWGEDTPEPATEHEGTKYESGDNAIWVQANHYVPENKYEVIIEADVEMTGLGGSFWTLSSGNAELRDNLTLSDDKKTMTITAESTTAPALYTPLYVMMPGEVNFGQIEFQWNEIDEETPGPEPTVTPYEYDTTCNLMKNTTFDVSKSYYAPDWSELAIPEVTEENGTYTYTLTAATYLQWQAQLKFISDVETNKDNTYDFSVTLKANQDVNNVTVKLYNTGDDNVFYLSDVVNLKANEALVVKHEAMAGLDMKDLCILIDAGGNPANTTIQMIQPVLKESGCTTGEAPVEEVKLYLLGGKNDWGFANNEELVYDEAAQAFKYEIDATDDHYFAFADKNDCADWDELNGEHRYAIAAGDNVPELNTEIQLVKVNGTIKLAAGKYTVTVTKDLKMTITGEATPVDPDGISNIAAEKQNGVIYNLQGQRVNAAQKGIYIMNGKKYMK